MSFFAKTRKINGCLAICFQEDGICAAHVVRSPVGLPSVEFIGFFPFAEPLAIASLEKVAKEVHAERYQCSTLLSFSEYQVLTVDAPNVPAEELKTAVRWKLKDLLDYHVDDATIDVMDIPADKNAAVRSKSMFLVAARNQLVQQRQDLFTQAKFPLSVIDVPEMAQRNIAALVEPEGRGLAMLSFDQNGGLLTVTSGGELYLSRRIDMPIAALEQADEAERTASFDRVTLELQRSLDHFDRQFHFVALSKLILAPMGKAGDGLQQYLATNLYLPVETLELPSVIDMAKVPDLRQASTQQRFFLTLGAALRHEEKVL